MKIKIFNMFDKRIKITHNNNNNVIRYLQIKIKYNNNNDSQLLDMREILENNINNILRFHVIA